MGQCSGLVYQTSESSPASPMIPSSSGAHERDRDHAPVGGAHPAVPVAVPVTRATGREHRGEHEQADAEHTEPDRRGAGPSDERDERAGQREQ